MYSFAIVSQFSRHRIASLNTSHDSLNAKTNGQISASNFMDNSLVFCGASTYPNESLAQAKQINGSMQLEERLMEPITERSMKRVYQANESRSRELV